MPRKVMLRHPGMAIRRLSRWLAVVASLVPCLPALAASPVAPRPPPGGGDIGALPHETGAPPAATGPAAAAVVRVHERIHLAPGRSNVWLVGTDDGVVIINTGSGESASQQRDALRAVNSAAVRYLVLTDADYGENIALWAESGTRVVAQQGHVTQRQQQARIAPFLAARAVTAGDVPLSPVGAGAGAGPATEADILFADSHVFTLGGMQFEVHAMPGRSPDAAMLWLPQLGAAFASGDFNVEFPDLYLPDRSPPYSLQGHVTGLERIRAFAPSLLLGSEGAPIRGKERVLASLGRHRQQLLRVHDAVVAGMNAGKSLATLIHEISPAVTDPSAASWRVAWAVRGIHDAYAGWYDGDPASLFAETKTSPLAVLGEMAGGADRIAARAQQALAAGDALLALRLADAALEVDRRHRASWEVRHQALSALLATSTDAVARRSLQAAVRSSQAALLRSVADALAEP